MAEQVDYLIIGAGIFGLSTAYHLAKDAPNASIVLLDEAPSPVGLAASSDLNKIVRADYPDVFYMRLALEALDLWETDPLYKPFFNQTGMLFADDIGMGDASYANYRKLGIDNGAAKFSIDEARAKFPVFRSSNWTDVKDTFYNPKSGWARADAALDAVMHAVLDAGVRFIQGKVQVLNFDSNKTCVGATTTEGRTVTAAKTVLCTGAMTAKILADSDPHWPELQAHGRMVAAAAVSCKVKIAPEHLYFYKDAPVHFLGMYHTRGESIPATKDGILKFNFENSFTNMQTHEASGQEMSIPPTSLDQKTWSHAVPEKLKKSVRTVAAHVYGPDAPGLEIESYRMCWDAITPNQDWIISPHSAVEGLFIAGGGSFHSWKFLPNVGKYVVEMLHGTLDPKAQARWSWNRPSVGAACEMYLPKHDLKDF